MTGVTTTRAWARPMSQAKELASCQWHATAEKSGHPFIEHDLAMSVSGPEGRNRGNEQGGLVASPSLKRHRFHGHIKYLVWKDFVGQYDQTRVQNRSTVITSDGEMF